ncbi:MAG: hypothetical protein E7516_06175 [Ruminococcaceae bacterium]|nr:hypothetical protein [Oscillospiraceae bacterium]
MKTKAARIFSSIKYELCIFMVLAVQAVSNLYPDFSVGEYTRLYYLVDYSMGKTSRLLIGSLVKLLNPDPSPRWIAGFCMIVLAVVLLFSAIIIGKVIKCADSEIKAQALVLTAFAITGMFTFSNFSLYLGFLDIWMFIIAIIAMLCIDNKYLRWLVPVLCAVGVFIHSGFAATYFPLFGLAVLYLVFSKEKKFADSVVFIASCAVTVAATLWVLVKGAGTATITYEQFFETLKNKGGFTYTDFGIENIAFYFLDIPPENTGITAEMVAGANAVERLIMMVKVNLADISLTYTVSLVIFGTAVIAACWAVWVKCMKNTESKGRKFVYLCFMLSVLTIPLGMIIAQDFIRWYQSAIITQFALAMFMLVTKDEPFKKTMQQIGFYFKDKTVLLAIIFIVYATAQPYGLTA